MRPVSFRLAAVLVACAVAPAALAQPDLCADGPNDITIDHVFGDPLPQVSYTVMNCGDAEGLNWNANPVGVIGVFVSLDNPGGIIQEVNGTDDVNVQFDLSAAPIGVQQVGAIRFFQGLDSKASKVIRFTLFKTPFELGDSLIGDLTAVDDREVGAFEGLKGQKVKLTFKAADKSMRARITIAEADGTPIKSFKSKKKGKKTKKKVTLPSTGEFAIIVEPIKGTGTYSMNTTRKSLPNLAEPRLLNKLKAPNGSDTVEVAIGAYPGALLNANVMEAGSTDIDTLTVTLLRPNGATLDTSSFDSIVGGAFNLVQVPLADFGLYRLRVSGMTPDDAVNVQIVPFQPDPATGEVDLDD